MQSTHSNPLSATLKGIVDVFRSSGRVGRLSPEDRIDGMVCMVTGANSGLGKAIATQLAARGGTIIMACRTMDQQAREEIVRRSGNDRVTMRHFDLGDLDEVSRFCDSLRDDGITLDRLVLNAGMIASGSRSTPQGFDQVIGVNYVGNFFMVNRLLADGILPLSDGNSPSRLVVVSSEAHRWPREVTLRHLEQPTSYSMSSALTQYAYSKFYLTAFVSELTRQLDSTGGPLVSVHALCPGAVNSRIAREAPRWTHPLISVVFGLFFRTPERAAEPAVYLCCTPTLEQHTGVYLHVMARKDVDRRASATSFGEKLWARTTELIEGKGIRVPGPDDRVRRDR